jgi:pimeloyl-ACP methyl ester carboxylesterase
MPTDDTTHLPEATRATAMRKGYVDTSSGQVHYRTNVAPKRAAAGAAPDGREVLVLFHQTASSSSMFERLAQALGDTYRIVAPDTPGFGGTFSPPEPATIPYYAGVLGEALDGLGVDTALVFGHHTGASIAVELEAQRPGFSKRMILSGPPYLSPEKKRALASKTEPIVVRDDGGHTLATWKRLRAKDPAAPLALTQREFVLTMHAGERYHEAYDAVFAHDFEEKLARVACPVLVMAGTEDTLYASLEPAYAALANGRKHVIPGANTYVCDRHAEEIAARLREFFGARA